MNGSKADEHRECEGALDAISSISLTILNSLSGLASVGGNIPVLLAIYKFPRLHTTSNYFIASLANADFVVGLVINPIWAIKSALNIWENQAPITIAAECLSIHTIAATTFSLCAVSIDRYLAVVSVFRYSFLLTVQRCRVAIFLTWLSAILMPVPRLFLKDPLDLPKLWIAGSVLIFIIPLSIIAFCYFHIFRAARSQARKIRVTSVQNETERKEAANHLKERKAALTIAIIIGLFILFWSPGMILSTVQMLIADDCLKIELIRWWSWSALLAFTNSAVNPWVYAIRAGEFRGAFWKLFRGNHSGFNTEFSRTTAAEKTKRNTNMPPASAEH